jgi:hypothetical protein
MEACRREYARRGMEARIGNQRYGATVPGLALLFLHDCVCGGGARGGGRLRQRG